MIAGSQSPPWRQVPGLSRAWHVSTRAWCLHLALAGLLGLVWWGIATRAYEPVYRAFAYAVIAHRVTAGAPSTLDGVERLNWYVETNVRGAPGAPVEDDSAADTLVRGFGYCDSTDTVLVRLLEEIGVPARVMFLETGTGDSPHSVAEVYLDGDWRVFDPYYGFQPQAADGSPATAQEIATDPTLGALVESFGLQPAWFAQAQVGVAPDLPSGPRAMLHSMLDTAIDHAPDWLLNGLQELYLKLPAPDYPADVDYETEPPGTPSAYSGADGKLYFAARNYQVFLRSADAANAYERLLQDYPKSHFADDALFHLGQLNVTQRDYPLAALADLRRLQAEEPWSHWLPDVGFFKSIALKMLHG